MPDIWSGNPIDRPEAMGSGTPPGAPRPLSASEILNRAVQEAAATPGALGGLVHLRDPDAGRLSLVVVAGLVPEIAGAWVSVGEDDVAAPARAVRTGAFVWVPDDGTGVGSGTAAVPLLGRDGPIGALSVIVVGAGQPDPALRFSLAHLRSWAARELARLPDPASEVTTGHGELPVLVEGSGGGAPRVVEVRQWTYDRAADSLTLAQPLAGVPGAPREGFGDSERLRFHLAATEDLPKFKADIRAAFDSGTAYEAAYRVRRGDGTEDWVRAHGHLVRDDGGGPGRLVGTLWSPADSGAAPDPVMAAAALHTMGDAFVTVTEDWRITFLNDDAERLLGTGAALIGSSLWEIPAGRVPGLEAQCRRAQAERKPISVDLRWPADQSFYRVRLLPLPFGGLSVHFVDITDIRSGGAERPEDGRIAAERTDRMGVLTVALAEAVTSADVVRAVAEHVLPPFGADGLVVEVLEEDRLHVVGSSGYPDEFLRRIEGIPLADHSAAAEVLRRRTPRFIESYAEAHRRYPRLNRAGAASAKNAWAFLPLIASGHAIGCCVISFSRPRSFSEGERTLLTALSGLIAQALERARLYDVEHSRAQELQRGLLPETLPVLPAVSAAARYMPAGKGEEVGGDWYDLIPLSGDRVAIVIGDVMGHGITEAAVMGRLRTAVRALADLELSPAELMSHLSEIVAELGHDKFATCSYAVFDPATRVCSLCLAGHLPPFVVHPDGRVHHPDLTVDPPLGIAEPPLTMHELRLPEQSLLVFSTDGLIESATRDIDEGLARLRQALTRAVAGTSYFPTGTRFSDPGPLDDLCDVIVSALMPDREQTNDDAVLLIAHTRGTPAESVTSYGLPDDPRAAGQARRHVREQLSTWGLDDFVMSTELLVSELVGNVIRHSKGPIRLRLLRSRSLICEVYDSSLTTPRIRHAAYTDEGGRGLQLVAALSQRWGTRYVDGGKCIWTEQDLPATDGGPRS